MMRTWLGLAGLGLFLPILGCSPTLGVLRKDNPSSEETVTHKASTYMAFADYRVSILKTGEVSPQQKRLLAQEARLSYLKALEVEPKNLQAHLSLARLQAEMGDLTAAEATLNKALELAPREAGLWYEIGLVQSRRQNYENSLGSLRKAVEIAPDNRMFQTTIGFTLARSGKVDEAIVVLSDVVGEPRAYFDLARLMRHMGQDDRARQLAQAAQARDPKLPGLQEFLAGKAPADRQSASTEGHLEPVKEMPKLLEPKADAVSPGATTTPAGGAPVIIQGSSPEANSARK